MEAREHAGVALWRVVLAAGLEEARAELVEGSAAGEHREALLRGAGGGRDGASRIPT